MIKRIRSSAAFLASFEIWLVALAVAASMVSERALPIALVVAGIFWLIRWPANRRLTIRTPADWGVALLLLMLPVTLSATVLPETTRPQVYRLLTGIALYYAIVNWTTSPVRVRRLINGTVLAGLLLALSAPVTVQWQSGKLPFIPASLYERFSLFVSDTIHSNVMAGSLVILLPSVLAILLFGWRQLNWSERVLAIMALLMMGSILVLTQSRGGLIGLGAALAVMALLYWRWSWLPLLALGAIGALIVQSKGITTRLNALTSSGSLTSLEGRIEAWSRTLYMIQDFPFTGIGMGSFGPIVDTFYPLFLAAPDTVPHAHNLFLQVAVDLGIPGLIAWLAILLLVMLGAWELYQHGRRTGDGWVAGIGAGLLCSQIALMIHGLTDAVTWGMVRPAPIVWGLWGLTMAAWRVLAVEAVKRSQNTNKRAKEAPADALEERS